MIQIFFLSGFSCTKYLGARALAYLVLTALCNGNGNHDDNNNEWPPTPTPGTMNGGWARDASASQAPGMIFFKILFTLQLD